MALQVVDRTMQAFGAEGLSQDQDLAFAFANLRTLRIADVSCIGLIAITLILTLTLQGPDAVCLYSRRKFSSTDRFFILFFQVHIQQVGQRELKRAPALARKAAENKKKEAVLFGKHGLKVPQ